MRLGYGLLTCQRPPNDSRSDVEIYAEALDYAVAAEAAGLDSIWTSEHHFVDDGYTPAQLPILAAIAARTSRIELGTGVLLAPLFDPLRLAEDAAVVDLLSRGRLVLGLGLGWRVEEFEGFGVPMRERARRLEGTITVLRQAWGDGLVIGDERTFHFPGLNVTPKPARPGGPPIWIGGGAEPAVRRAARLADGYLASGASPRAFRERVGWVHDEAERIGRDPAEIDLGIHRMAFAWRDGDAWERVREAAWYMTWKYLDMGQARSSRSPRPAPPLSPEREAELRGRVIAGTPEQVADGVREYAAELGSDGLFIFRAHFPGLDPGVQRESFRILVEEVVPLLR